MRPEVSHVPNPKELSGSLRHSRFCSMILDLAALNIRMAAYKVLCAQAMDQASPRAVLFVSSFPGHSARSQGLVCSTLGASTP